MKHALKAVSISAGGLAVAGALTMGLAYGFVSGLLTADPAVETLTANDEEEER